MEQPFRLIDHGRWRAATPPPVEPPDSEPPDAEREPLAAFCARAWRLPTFARTHTQHEINPSGPGNAPAARALRALQGKFVVVNQPNVVPLPMAARPALRQAVRRRVAAVLDALPAAAPAAALADVVEDAVRAAVAPEDAPLVDVALYEPTVPVIVQQEQQGFSSGNGPEVRFAGELIYRLVVRIGGGDDAPPPAAEPAAGVTRRTVGSTFWFHLPLLVPDAEALAGMTAPTEHLYRDVTGRLGVGTDRYWQVPAWERFREQGTVIGCVMPSLVEHGYTPGVGRPPASAPREPADPLFDAPVATSLFPTLTPDFDRRGFVPPGYCLVRYYAWVEVVVE